MTWSKTPAIALLVLVATACATGTSETDDIVGTSSSALTADDCTTEVGIGKNTICHFTSSTASPYTLLSIATQACVHAHIGHSGDFLASPEEGCACVPHGASCGGIAVGCCGGEQCDAATSTCQPSITTGRYWRIELAGVDKSQGSSAVLTEVEMQWDSTVHVLTGTTISSPDFWGGNPLTTLIDGSLDQSLGCYGCDYAYTDVLSRLDFDLGTPRSVESILISQGGFREADGLEWTITSLNVYSSADGVTYTLVRTFDGILRSDWTAETLKPFSLL